MIEHSIWKSLLVEGLGTCLLTLVVGSVVAQFLKKNCKKYTYSDTIAGALAYGLTLTVLIYLFSGISGAHFNPIVSFAFALAGQMGFFLMIAYIIVQCVGAIVGGAIVLWFYGNSNGAGASIGSATNSDQWKAIFAEAVITMFLVLAYLMVYRNPMLAIISGVAIGLVLAVSFFAVAPLTGASANPARSLGTAIFGQTLSSYWIYIVGPLLGGIVAVIVYKIVTYDWNCKKLRDECGNVIKDECGNCIKECCKPMYDKCGKVVRDECGNVMTEKFTKIDHKYGYKPETIKSAVGHWMADHHMSVDNWEHKVENFKQSLANKMSNVMPNAMPSAMPSAMQSSNVSMSVPKVSSAASYMNSADIPRSPKIASVSVQPEIIEEDILVPNTDNLFGTTTPRNTIANSIANNSRPSLAATLRRSSLMSGNQS